MLFDSLVRALHKREILHVLPTGSLFSSLKLESRTHSSSDSFLVGESSPADSSDLSASSVRTTSDLDSLPRGTMASSLAHYMVAVVGTSTADSTLAAAAWKPPMATVHFRGNSRISGMENGTVISAALSPCLSPVMGGIGVDLSVACQAYSAEVEAFPGGASAREYGSASKGKGVAVYVMMPLDSVTMENKMNRKKAMDASLQALKNAGVEGIMMDVWWGLVEREAPREYNWGGYAEFLEMAEKHRLKVQAVMSFHQCGGNVGDSCTIPLPRWVVEEMNSDPNLTYTDQWGRRNYEYVSLGCDAVPVLKGRTPVQCYSDFMRAFRENFRQLLGDTIVEIQVGMGPAGELRYPSYPEQNGTWRFPGIGAFQCFDKYMLSSLKSAAEAAGKPEWGSTGPTDAGSYNNWPEDAQFFRRENGGWASAYGEFFLNWYSELLLDHGDRILSSAASIFDGVKISAKIAGIHWHYGTRSHAAELTAGYYNTRYRDGYIPIARMLARQGAIFNFTCIEMRDYEQPQHALCAPEQLVRQVSLAAAEAEVPLAGENALQRYDEHAHEQILRASGGMCAFTYLRMNRDLFQPENWRKFVAFVKKMNEGKDAERCSEELEREAEQFVHLTRPLVEEAASALMH